VTAIYVIAAVLVVLFLAAAYRSMGAGASTGEDPTTVLVAVLATTGEAFAALDAEPETDSARAVRRQLDGCSQALERIAATPVDETLDSARTALELAVDELSWSARLRETSGYARDPGLREAEAGLRGHATANLAQAHAVLDVFSERS
jgi:hypothetical protein